MRDWSGIFLGAIIVVILSACVSLVILQSKENHELERQAVACEQNKATKDYLKCIAPIRAKQKQIQEDADDAAMVSTMITLSAAATVQ